MIDPKTERIVARHALAGGKSPHGLLIVAPKRLAFAACDGDSKLLVVDLNTFEVKQVLETGEGPDVLAFDTALERLYVATESDIVSVFQLQDRTLRKLEDLRVAPNAHTIYGHPVLRIMKPTAP